MSKSNLIARNTGLLFFRMLIVMAVGLFTSRLVLEALGLEDFGIYNVVGGIVVLFAFIKSALYNAIYRHFAYAIGQGDEAGLSRTFSMAVKCYGLLALITVVIMEALGPWFLHNYLVIPAGREEAALVVFHCSLFQFALNILQMPYYSLILAEERMDFFALLSLFEVGQKLLVVYALYWIPYDRLCTYGLILSAVAVVLLLAHIGYCRWQFKCCRFDWMWDGKLFRKLCSFSGWSLIVNMADVAIVQCISLFFNWFGGVLLNAALGVMNQVNDKLLVFLDNFSQSLDPQLIKSYAAGERDYFEKLLYAASKLSYFLLLLVAFPVWLNIEFLLEKWLGNYPPLAPWFIKAIILSSLVNATQRALTQAVYASGKLRRHQLTMVAIKLFGIPLMYLILWQGGEPLQVMYSWVLINAACAVARVRLLQGIIGLDVVRYLREVVARILLTTLIVVPLPYWLSGRMEGWSALLSSILASSLLTIIGVWLVGLTPEERGAALRLGVVRKVMNRLGLKRFANR